MSIWSSDLKAKLFNGSKVPYFKSDSKTLVLNTDILINSNFSHVCTAQYDGLLKFTRNKGLFLDFRSCKEPLLWPLCIQGSKDYGLDFWFCSWFLEFYSLLKVSTQSSSLFLIILYYNYPFTLSHFNFQLLN